MADRSPWLHRSPAHRSVSSVGLFPMKLVLILVAYSLLTRTTRTILDEVLTVRDGGSDVEVDLTL